MESMKAGAAAPPKAPAELVQAAEPPRAKPVAAAKPQKPKVEPVKIQPPIPVKKVFVSKTKGFSIWDKLRK